MARLDEAPPGHWRLVRPWHYLTALGPHVPLDYPDGLPVEQQQVPPRV
jgi:hypothetical protein